MRKLLHYLGPFSPLGVGPAAILTGLLISALIILIVLMVRP